jgi:hypothetical protein
MIGRALPIGDRRGAFTLCWMRFSGPSPGPELALIIGAFLRREASMPVLHAVSIDLSANGRWRASEISGDRPKRQTGADST